MNRKVKFRAIVPVNSGDPKRLEYFDLSLDDDISRLLHADYDANELMQFTGLKDKNGKEIYELHEINSIFRIVFHFNRYILQNISNGDIVEFTENDEYKITGEYSPIPKD